MRERIYGYDVARSFAILGMVIVHFSLVMAEDTTRPKWLAAILEFLDGRAAATFVVLAGVGLSLMSRQALASGDAETVRATRRTFIARGLFLLALGFINLAIWPGDILRVYGVSLILAAMLVTASSRTLLLAAAFFPVGFIVLFALLDFEKNWDWSTMTYHHLWTVGGLSRNLFYDGFRSVFPWTGLLLFGMWLGRLDLRNRPVRRRVFWTALCTALFAEVASWLLIRYLLRHSGGLDRETIVALVGTVSMPALPLFILAAGGTAVVAVTASIALVDGWKLPVWSPLISTGQMALTWYFGHIVLGLGTVVTLELESSQPLSVAMVCGIGFFLFAVAISWNWKRWFQYGPLESLMRKTVG